ncbi:uncharacterized protein A4U43_C06F12670, partial [Asparagus officinalis]
MVGRTPGLIALFDVGETLTVPRNLRKVSIISLFSKSWGYIIVITDYDYVFAENGLVAYKNGELIGKQ